MLHATCNPESIPLTIPKLCRRASFSKKERFLGHPNTSPLCMPFDIWETLRAPWWTSRGSCFRVFKVIEQIERVFPGCVATCSGGGCCIKVIGEIVGPADCGAVPCPQASLALSMCSV